MKSEQWIGFRTGQLTIVAFEGLQRFEHGKAARFRFRCDCGREFSSQKSNVLAKRRNDCGHSVVVKWTAPHGASRDPVHKVWWHMIDRCQNPKSRSYKDYGQRGITVAHRWTMGENSLTGFECFLADMGPRPPGNYTIERVNSNGNYEPGNCMWLSKGDQSKNRRGVKLVRIGDRSQTIPDWCLETGVGYWTAIRRIYRGWPPDRAVTEKARVR